MKIGLATYAARAHPETHKPDDRMLRDALDEAGAQAKIFSWTDTKTDTTDFDAVVLRSCWDSHRNPTAFLQWLDQVDADRPRLINPRDVVVWNFHKEQYLSDLANLFSNHWPQEGQIVPSLFYTSHQTALHNESPFQSAKGKSLTEIFDEFDAQVGPMWQGRDIIVKPTISAEGENTFYIRRKSGGKWADTDDILWMNEAEAHIERLLKDTTWPGIIIQPALAGIRQGEYSLIYIAGEFSHAVRKLTDENDFKNRLEVNRVGISVNELPDGLLYFANQIMRFVIDKFSLSDITYARVDLVQEDHRMPILLELELADPNLQFVRIPEAFYTNKQAPTEAEIQQGDVARDDALNRFATAIINMAKEF